MAARISHIRFTAFLPFLGFEAGYINSVKYLSPSYLFTLFLLVIATCPPLPSLRRGRRGEYRGRGNLICRVGQTAKKFFIADKGWKSREKAGIPLQDSRDHTGFTF
jgi:hypothetical protein